MTTHSGALATATFRHGASFDAEDSVRRQTSALRASRNPRETLEEYGGALLKEPPSHCVERRRSRNPPETLEDYGELIRRESLRRGEGPRRSKNQREVRRSYADTLLRKPPLRCAEQRLSRNRRETQEEYGEPILTEPLQREGEPRRSRNQGHARQCHGDSLHVEPPSHSAGPRASKHRHETRLHCDKVAPSGPLSSHAKPRSTMQRRETEEPYGEPIAGGLPRDTDSDGAIGSQDNYADDATLGLGDPFLQGQHPPAQNVALQFSEGGAVSSTKLQRVTEDQDDNDILEKHELPAVVRPCGGASRSARPRYSSIVKRYADAPPEPGSGPLTPRQRYCSTMSRCLTGLQLPNAESELSSARKRCRGVTKHCSAAGPFRISEVSTCKTLADCQLKYVRRIRRVLKKWKPHQKKYRGRDVWNTAVPARVLSTPEATASLLSIIFPTNGLPAKPTASSVPKPTAEMAIDPGRDKRQTKAQLQSSPLENTGIALLLEPGLLGDAESPFHQLCMAYVGIRKAIEMISFHFSTFVDSKHGVNCNGNGANVSCNPVDLFEQLDVVRHLMMTLSMETGHAIVGANGHSFSENSAHPKTDFAVNLKQWMKKADEHEAVLREFLDQSNAQSQELFDILTHNKLTVEEVLSHRMLHITEHMQVFHESMMKHAEQAEKDAQTKATKNRFLYKYNSGDMSDQIRKRVVTRRQRVAEKLETAVNQRAQEARRMEETREYRRLMGIDDAADFPLSTVGFSPMSSPSASPPSLSPTTSSNLARRRAPHNFNRAINVDKLASLKDAARTVTKRLHEQYAIERTHISMAKVLAAQLEQCIEEREKTQLTADIARHAKMRMLHRERTMLYSSLNSRTTDVTQEYNTCRLACGLEEEATSAPFAKKKTPTMVGSRSQRIRQRELTELWIDVQGKLRAAEDELNALFTGDNDDGSEQAALWVTVDVSTGTAQWLAPLLEAKPPAEAQYVELDTETSIARGEEVILLQDDIYRTRIKKDELAMHAARCEEEAHNGRVKRELLEDLSAVQKDQLVRVTEIVRLQKQKASNKLLVKELATEVKHKKHLQKLLARSRRNGAQSKTQLHEFLQHVSTVNRFLLRRRGKYFRTFQATLRTCGYTEEARKIGAMPWQLSRERATKHSEDLKLLRERLRGIIRMLIFWRKRIEQLERDQLNGADEYSGAATQKTVSDRLAYERSGRQRWEFMHNSARERILGSSMSFHAVFRDALAQLGQDPNVRAIASDATTGHGNSQERANAFATNMPTVRQMRDETLPFARKIRSDRARWRVKVQQKMAGFVRRKKPPVPNVTVTTASQSLHLCKVGAKPGLDELALSRRKSMLARASRYSVFNFLSNPSRDGTDVQKAIAALKGHQSAPIQGNPCGIHGQLLGEGLIGTPTALKKTLSGEHEGAHDAQVCQKSHVAVVDFGDIVPRLGGAKGPPKNNTPWGDSARHRRRQSVETKANAELNEWSRHLKASKRRAAKRRSQRGRTNRGETSAGNATSDEIDRTSLPSPIGKSSQPMLRQFLSDTTDGVDAAPDSPLLLPTRNATRDVHSDTEAPTGALLIKHSGSHSYLSPRQVLAPETPQSSILRSHEPSPKDRRDAAHANTSEFDDNSNSSLDEQDEQKSDDAAKDETNKTRFEEVLDALRAVEPAAWQQLRDLQGVHRFTSEWRTNVTSHNQAAVPPWVECVVDIHQPAIDEPNVQVVTFYSLHKLALTVHSFFSIPRLLEHITVHVTAHPLRAVYVDVCLPGDTTLRLMPYDVRQIQKTHDVKLSTTARQDAGVNQMPTFEYSTVVSETQWTLKAMQVLRNIVLTEFGSFSKAYSEIPHIQTPHLGSPDTSPILPMTKPSCKDANAGRDNLHRTSFERYLTLRANLTFREVGKLYEYVDQNASADGAPCATSLVAQKLGAAVLSRADFSEALRRAAPMRSVVQFRARLAQHETSKEQFWQHTLAHGDLNAFCAAVEPWGVPSFDASFVFHLLPHGDYEQFERALVYAEALTLCRHISSAGPRAWHECESLLPTTAVTAESLRTHLQLPMKDAGILHDFVVFTLARRGATRAPQVKDVQNVVQDALRASVCAATRTPPRSRTPSPVPSFQPPVQLISLDPIKAATSSIASPMSPTATSSSPAVKRRSATRVSFLITGDSKDLVNAPEPAAENTQQYASFKGTILRQKIQRDITPSSLSVPRGSTPWLAADRVVSDPHYVALWVPVDNSPACKRQNARAILQKWHKRAEYDHVFATALSSIDTKISLTKQLNAFADIKEITIVSDFLLNKYDDDQPAQSLQKKQVASVTTAVREAVKLDTWEDFSRATLHGDLTTAPPELPFPLSAELARDSLSIPWADTRRLFEFLWEGHEACCDESERTRRVQSQGGAPIFPDADTFCRAAQCAEALANLRACAVCLESKYGSLDSALSKAPFPAERVVGKDDHTALHRWAGMEVNMEYVVPKTIGALIYTLQSDPMTPFGVEHTYVRVGAPVASNGMSDRPMKPRLPLLKAGGLSSGPRLHSPTMLRPDDILDEDVKTSKPNAKNIFVSPVISRTHTPTSPSAKVSLPNFSVTVSATPNTTHVFQQNSANKSLLFPCSVLLAVDCPQTVSSVSPQPIGAANKDGLKVPAMRRARTRMPCPSQRSCPVGSEGSLPISPMRRVSQRRTSNEVKKLQALLPISEHQQEQPSQPRSSVSVIPKARPPHKVGEGDPMQPPTTPRGDALWNQRMLAFSGSIAEIQVAICRVQDLFDKVYPKWRQCVSSVGARVKLFQLLDTRRDNTLDIAEIKSHVEKIQVSDGVWTVLDADRIFKVLNVGCTGAVEPTLTQSNFTNQLPVFVPVNTIPRLREHLIFMYGNLEDAFKFFDVGPCPADEQFSIDEFETRLFPWSVCDRDARSIFRQLDAVHNTGHISLLLLLCAIEHAESFTLLERKYPVSRLATMGAGEIAAVVAPSECGVHSATGWSPSSQLGQDSKRATSTTVTEDNFGHVVDLLWPADTGSNDDDDDTLRSTNEEVLLALRVPLLCGAARNPALDVEQVVRVLRTWANAKGGRKKKRGLHQVSPSSKKHSSLINAAVLKAQLQPKSDVSSILVVPANPNPNPNPTPNPNPNPSPSSDKATRSPFPEDASSLMPLPSPQIREKHASTFVVPLFSGNGAMQSSFVPIDASEQATAEHFRSVGK